MYIVPFSNAFDLPFPPLACFCLIPLTPHVIVPTLVTKQAQRRDDYLAWFVSPSQSCMS